MPLLQLCDALLVYMFEFTNDAGAICSMRSSRNMYRLRSQYTLKHAFTHDDIYPDSRGAPFKIRSGSMNGVGGLKYLPTYITRLWLTGPYLSGVPSHITHLTFGDWYDGRIPANSLPDSITHLSCGWSFNQPITAERLPRRLTHLTLSTYFNQPITSATFPESVTHLSFGLTFNQPLTPGCLPTALLDLTFGAYFTHPLPENVLPQSLQLLMLGYNYPHRIRKAAVPESVKFIDFRTGYITKTQAREGLF